MKTMTVPVTQNDIAKWFCVDFMVDRGLVTLRFQSTGGGQSIDLLLLLSDTAGRSQGAVLNANVTHWDDRITINGAAGVANALTNARNAYRGAASHAAGLVAVEAQGLTDLWVGGAFNGT